MKKFLIFTLVLCTLISSFAQAEQARRNTIVKPVAQFSAFMSDEIYLVMKSDSSFATEYTNIVASYGLAMVQSIDLSLYDRNTQAGDACGVIAEMTTAVGSQKHRSLISFKSEKHCKLLQKSMTP